MILIIIYYEFNYALAYNINTTCNVSLVTCYAMYKVSERFQSNKPGEHLQSNYS